MGLDALLPPWTFQGPSHQTPRHCLLPAVPETAPLTPSPPSCLVPGTSRSILGKIPPPVPVGGLDLLCMPPLPGMFVFLGGQQCLGPRERISGQETNRPETRWAPVFLGAPQIRPYEDKHTKRRATEGHLRGRPAWGNTRVKGSRLQG